MIYKRFGNILTPDQLEQCRVALVDGWVWGATSYSQQVDQYRFWSKTLTADKFFSEFMFNRILNLTGDNLTLDRVYANGQTYGLPGKIHVDSPNDSARTFLFYANPVWDPEWGGDTVILDEKKQTYSAQILPNTGIYFKGNMWHCGSEPTRFCRELRTTIVFKMTRHDND